MDKKLFRPPNLIAGRHMQTVLASSAPRRLMAGRQNGLVQEIATEVLVDCGNKVRLLGSHARAPGRRNEQLIIMIHGWEGSADSLYMQITAGTLLRNGYDVFRLNLRDHGPSHHLNKELFHSCRLQEVQGAVRWIQTAYPEQQISLLGFSLGGNFAMRVAAEAPQTEIRLRRAIAICPVLNPVQTMDALEYGWFVYRGYFIKKWRKSLFTKMGAFPDDYNFADITRFRSLKEMTAYFVAHHTEYPDLETYLNGYAITGNRLAELTVPSVVLLAEDDPVIPVQGLENIARSDCLQVRTTRHGGHCGFLQSYTLQSWLDSFVLEGLAGQIA
ncbi:MAG: YheT family hydrolase [Gammaproteobacteria bacterium]